MRVAADLVGVDDAFVAQQGTGDVDVLRGQGAEVFGAAGAGGEDHLDAWGGGVDHFNRLAGREDDLAVGGGDDAFVRYVFADQQDGAAGGGVDDAVVGDVALNCTGVKLVFASQEVCRADVRGGGHQPAYVNPRALAKDDAVGVD